MQWMQDLHRSTPPCQMLHKRICYCWGKLFQHLQVPSRGLIQLYTLEQSFEVSSSKALMIVSLDDFNEDCWTILERFGEDLEKVPIIIIVNQNLQLLQHCQIFLHLKLIDRQKYLINDSTIFSDLDFGVRETFSEHVVVRVWNIEKLLSSGSQVSDGLDDVMRSIKYYLS